MFRVAAMEAALERAFTPDAVAAIKLGAENLSSDIHADAEYRAHLVTVMAKKAVMSAALKHREARGESRKRPRRRCPLRPNELARLSAVEMLDGYRTRRFTPRDVIEDVISALEADQCLLQCGRDPGI